MIRIDLANFCKLCHLAGRNIQLYICNMNQFSNKRPYCPDEENDNQSLKSVQTSHLKFHVPYSNEWFNNNSSNNLMFTYTAEYNLELIPIQTICKLQVTIVPFFWLSSLWYPFTKQSNIHESQSHLKQTLKTLYAFFRSFPYEMFSQHINHAVRNMNVSGMKLKKSYFYVR